MAAYVFSKINIDYAGLYGDAYSDMTDKEIDLLPKVLDSIVSSLLPDWLSWCGDELLAEKDDPSIDEDFDVQDVLNRAWETLCNDDLNSLASLYGVSNE